MMLATACEMREIDRLAAEKYKIPPLLLMEHAAQSVYKHCVSFAPQRTVIIAGGGNNGGDGFALARLLYLSGMEVLLYCIGGAARAEASESEESQINVSMLSAIGVNILDTANVDILSRDLREADIVVDAIFGTGLHGEINGEIQEIIELINSLDKQVISIDIPSGICCDNGAVLGCAVKADITVTFQYMKPGLLLYPGCEYAGAVFVEDIGIPHVCGSHVLAGSMNYLDRKELLEAVPKRRTRSNKGDYGKCLFIGGSRNMPGAALLALKSMYKCGAGLVYAAVPESVRQVLQPMLPEAIVYGLRETVHGTLCAASLPELMDIVGRINPNVTALGPGMANSPDTQCFVNEVIKNINSTLVMDADALNAISGDLTVLDIFADKQPRVVITPHPGEMSRLTGTSIEEILKNTAKTAQCFAVEHNIIVLLKDFRTIIAGPERLHINTTGNSSMSKAGAGDVLTGVIAALIAQGMMPYMAAVVGAYMHGAAGDRLKERSGMYGVTAGELADELPFILFEG